VIHHQDVSSTYADVDGHRDPGEAVAWQERVNRRSDVQVYKQHTYALVSGADRVLDVGCGPGTDAAALSVAPGFRAGPMEAHGRPARAGGTALAAGAVAPGWPPADVGRSSVIGLDPSNVMCRHAAEQGVVVCRGDAHALPFADGAFDACRADRVVQHLVSPVAAIDEMVRVVRPGGRVVVADPDQESLVLHVPGVDRALVDQVKALRRDVGYRNGRLASRLPELFVAAGLIDVRVAAFPLVMTDPADAFGLASWPRAWHGRGVGEWTEPDLQQWDVAFAGPLDGTGFVYALLYLVVSGTCPS
jgi:ubiquinone/menaquinone biosynthesis C-methylase UbiE